MNILSVCFGFLGKGSGGRPHPALCATFPCEGKATLFPPKSGFPQKIFLAIMPFSCYDTFCRDDGEWQGSFHAESCRRVQGSWRELRSAPERAMTNRRGAPHTAQTSGADMLCASWVATRNPSVPEDGAGGFLFTSSSKFSVLSSMPIWLFRLNGLELRT